MNLVVLTGNVARDVELSYLPNNNQMAVAHFTLAVDRPKRNGEDQGTDYLRITVWGRQAENCDRYLSKGSKVAVRGRIETGSYTNREGLKVYTTEVVADTYNGVEFLGGGNRGGGSGNSGNGEYHGGNAGQNMSAGSGGAATRQENFTDFDDLPDSFQSAEDDVPF